MTSPAPASPASDRTIGSTTTAAAGAPASTYVALLVADGRDPALRRRGRRATA
ncbi:hypothetical protein [Clavibacter michiganensis]|uniref:hypothetical protein n=1 Tax=Clavibacter michiganensis TaxID=28447 RepID=UPI00292D3DE2|nr:hypothetical protein [Clavibacter michiganensis]